MNYRIDFSAIAWETPLAGIRHKREKVDGVQLRLVEYDQEMAPHWCEREHIGWILAGRFEISFEGEVQVYGPGDGVFIPGGSAHRHMGRVIEGPVRAVFVEQA
jgi:quercetin dioxygenase-like cupin family protein